MVEHIIHGFKATAIVGSIVQFGLFWWTMCVAPVGLAHEKGEYLRILVKHRQRAKVLMTILAITYLCSIIGTLNKAEEHLVLYSALTICMLFFVGIYVFNGERSQSHGANATMGGSLVSFALILVVILGMMPPIPS
ncbi:MAG: hypothetical protein JWO43_100 [Candidatus Adlerbacteria bacterium]|nr:hypothetical protein [Candidatus Adlerbacteria bacterium]